MYDTGIYQTNRNKDDFTAHNRSEKDTRNSMQANAMNAKSTSAAIFCLNARKDIEYFHFCFLGFGWLIHKQTNKLTNKSNILTKQNKRRA